MTDESRLSYLPAVDGLRALAVSAVVAYHAGIGWAKGGFLGVDVFFVISGYLITGLLLADHQRNGRIRLAHFWRRRARRLLPALFLLLVAVAVVVPLLASDQAHRLRPDLLAALGYVSNWWLIFEDQSYFEAIGRQPLLQHLWSLAVEEQFYILWPPALILLLRWRRDPRRLVAPILGLAAASAVLMAILHDPTADPSRVYFGTDTRVAGILVGAALGCIPITWTSRRQIGLPRRAALEGVGIAALWGLWLCLSRVDQFDPLLYRGGFLGAAVLAAVAVVVATHPRSWVAAGLGTRPLVWLGRRSYAVYLWFWPVLMLTRPHSDVPLTGMPLLALRISLTLALATASYRWVEQPIRDGALGRVWSEVRAGVARRGREPSIGALRWMLGASLAVMAAGTGVLASHAAEAPTLSIPVAAGEVPGGQLSRGGAASSVEEPAAAAAAAAPADTAPVAQEPEAAPVQPAPAPTAPIEPAPAPAGGEVTAIGESVMISARAAMEAEGMYVDAAIGRQFPESLAAVHSLREQGLLDGTVIVHLGNNGPVSEGQFKEMMGILSGAERVVVVNVRVPRPWERHNNDLFAALVPQSPNAVIADWRSTGARHPAAFVNDGVHITAGGVRVYMELLRGAM